MRFVLAKRPRDGIKDHGGVPVKKVKLLTVLGGKGNWWVCHMKSKQKREKWGEVKIACIVFELRLTLEKCGRRREKSGE